MIVKNNNRNNAILVIKTIALVLERKWYFFPYLFTITLLFNTSELVARWRKTHRKLMVWNGKWQLANDTKDKTKQNKNIRFGSFISLVCEDVLTMFCLWNVECLPKASFMEMSHCREVDVLTSAWQTTAWLPLIGQARTMWRIFLSTITTRFQFPRFRHKQTLFCLLILMKHRWVFWNPSFQK